MAKDAAAKRESFEQLYARLEEHVQRLEQGGLSLEESIALYEQGMTLARECQTHLEEADQKITKLKESFAASVPRTAAGALRDDAEPDYEYVPDGDAAPGDTDDLP